MNPRAMLDRLVQIEEALAITDPVSMQVKKAWKFIPPARVALSEFPCVLNGLQLQPTLNNMTLLRRIWEVRIQLIVGDAEAEADTKADIAAAFLEQFTRDLAADMTLNGTVSHIISLAGAGEAAIAALERNRRLYIGLDLVLTAEMAEAQVYAA